MFLICGETLFDVFASEAQGSTLRFDAVPGGSPFNVAVGLARLGCRARLLTGLSTEFLGDSLARAIRASGIELDHLVRLDAPTTLGFVNRRTDGSDEDFHSLYGDAAPAALAAGWLAAGCALVVLTRGADGLEAWTKHAHVSVDSFPVPRLIDTMGAGDTGQAALLAHLDTHHALQAAAVTCGRKGADMPRRGDLH